MKRKITSRLSANQSDLVVAFYDAAVDYSRENFEMIAKRVVPKGFGKSKSSAAFKREKPVEVLILPVLSGGTATAQLS